MPSLQSQVIATVVDALNAVPGGPRAWRCRMNAFASSQLPGYNVLPEDGEAEYTTTSAVDRKLRFNVRCMAVAIDEVDAVVDPLYVAAVQTLLADSTLGGLVMVTREVKQKWEMEKGEVAAVALVVTFEAEFTTSRSDPGVRKF